MTTTHRNPMKTETNPIPEPYSWQFDPLDQERGIEITYEGVAFATTSTLKNAEHLKDKLNESARLAAVNGELVAVLEAIAKKCDALEQWIWERNLSCDPEETIPPEIENELPSMREAARAALARAGGAQ